MTTFETVTTLNAIRAQHPCEDGWRKLLAHLGKTAADNEPLPLLTVLKSNGLDDALEEAAKEAEKDARLMDKAFREGMAFRGSQIAELLK